ncbi:MAG: DedA family protein [Desulfobacterales bacterium]|nr:DedA family protein [Desulfobacterales bacterium]
MAQLESLPDLLIYIFLGLSAFLENLFPPIPGDTVTAFGAFLVGAGKLDLMGVYIATTLGSLLGFLTLFWIGRWLGRRFFVERDFRFLKARDIVKAERWLVRYGYLLVALNRFLPGVRSAISLAVGITRLKVIWVALLAFISASVWNLIWILLGRALGAHWGVVEKTIRAIVVRYNTAVFILFALLILFLLVRKRFTKGQ